MDDFIKIGYPSHIIKETYKAVLFRIGTDNFGREITRFLPKSQMYQKNGFVCIPKWLARNLGIWNDEVNQYCSNGYYKMYEDDYDELPF